MQHVCIDTNNIIEYLEKDTGIVKDILEAENYELCTSVACITELYTANSLRAQEVEDALKKFLETYVHVYDVTPAIAKRAGKLVSTHWLTLAESYIAATCLENDIPLITSNIKTFDQVPNLQLVETQA